MTTFVNENMLNKSAPYTMLLHFADWNEILGWRILNIRKGQELGGDGVLTSLPEKPCAQMEIFVRVAEHKGENLTSATFIAALNEGNETPISRVKVAYPPAWNEQSVSLVPDEGTGRFHQVPKVDAWVKFTLAYLSKSLLAVLDKTQVN